MSLPQVFNKLKESGVEISLHGKSHIRMRMQTGSVPLELVQSVKERKSEIVAYIQRLHALRVGSRVSCPHGVGRVFETYPLMDRCGVYLDTYSWPQFFGIMDVIPKNENLSEGQIGYHKTKS